jgi:tetratricopeptide (TPR) repeat protein
MGISLCMIVRNEERFLAAALTSVQGVVDEICIVDTGSTDATVAIAASFGARLAHLTWSDDFSHARNAALALATRPWILVLDADERLAPGSRAELRALGDVPPDGRGRWIRARNLQDETSEIAVSTNAIVRIFPNDPAIRYRGRLHEFVARDGEAHSLAATRTSIEILHAGYAPAIMAARSKGERNLRVSEAELAADPDDPALVYNYAMSASLAGRRDLARVQLERVVALTAATPRGFRPQALNILAGLYLDEGRAAEALDAADRCVAIADTLPDAHFVRGRALVALGRLHEARDAFGAAIAHGDHAGDHFVVADEIVSWKAHNEIAGTLMRERRFADARRWLELALRERPAEPTLLRNLARCCEDVGDLPAALAAARGAFEAHPDRETAIAFVNLVFRHGSADDGETVVQGVLSAVDVHDRCVLLASAAALMVRAGRPADASRLLGQLVAIQPDRRTTDVIVAALAAQYDCPALQVLLARAEPLIESGGHP